MATHRAHNLLHVNPVLWLGEMKRQDPRLACRLLLIKERKKNDTNQCRKPGLLLIASRKSQSLLPLSSVNFWSSPPVGVPKWGTSDSVLNLKGTQVKGQASGSPQVAASPAPSNDKPSADQLLVVYDSIQKNLPRIFTHTMDYRIYSQDVVLINNIHNKTTHGLFKYIQQVALLRLAGHLKFAFVKVNLVSMSQHPMEGRITVKWQVVGISGLRVMFKFWKFKLWEWKEIMQQKEVWYDIISHFDVGPDGLVYRHIADKVEEDKEQLDVRKPSKSHLVAKLALIAALFPRNGLGEAIACQSVLQISRSSTTNTALNTNRASQKSSNSVASLEYISP